MQTMQHVRFRTPRPWENIAPALYRLIVISIFGTFGGLVLPDVAFARGADAAALCEGAASEASTRIGVPLAILRAIALTETGRPHPDGAEGLSPWPWAINKAGEGHWFASREEAMAYAVETLDRGSSNVDLGCFQLNVRWHAEGFVSLADMLAPLVNALYAARLLKGLHSQYGDWSKAAGAYHSATPARAAQYRKKFDAIYASIEDRAQPAQRGYAFLAPRQNSFPLLRSGTATANGSLVPILAAGRRLIGGKS